MNRDWILQQKETRRTFSKATWVPLRASRKYQNSTYNVTEIGHICEYFGCGSVAFPPEHREKADALSWNDIGISHSARPYAYEDGTYTSIDEYQYNDKEPIGVELVFEYRQPVVGNTEWILNPDLVVALRLIKEGKEWIRPEEDFVVVAREEFDEEGSPCLIEIKREFLIDYLAARRLSLRLSYYRQRVENVSEVAGTDYIDLSDQQEKRDGGYFELSIRTLNDVFGGDWASMRIWRTDINEDEDAPVMGPENNANTAMETREGTREVNGGVRVVSEFWRDEWIDHQGRSVRVRGDTDDTQPRFAVDTDGTKMASPDLNNEDIGRWLWFRPSVVSDLINRRGFVLKWYTAETGGIRSTSGSTTHFGINSSDLITVYACDIARLPTWEQHVWAVYNVVPEGGVSSELLAAQVRTQPASTEAAEDKLFLVMRMLEMSFHQELNVSLFNHPIDDADTMRHVCRFASRDQASLLRLAKDIVRVFSDRLNIGELRKLSNHPEKDKLRSNKLLEDVVAQKIGSEQARKIFGPIVGAYDMRLGDAHPTSSRIGEAIALAGIDESNSFLRQGEQLIFNFGHSVWQIGVSLFGRPDSR